MNIYLVVEDGCEGCIRATSMMSAVERGLQRYLEGVSRHIAPDGRVESLDLVAATGYYHSTILESCTLVGELIN